MNAHLKIMLEGLVVAFTGALLLVPAFMLLARRLGVVDHPGGRKRHERVTPLLGGAGVVAACSLGYLVATSRLGGVGVQIDFSQIRYVLAGGLVLFVLGLLDDVFKDRLPFQLKLLGQVLGVLVLMAPHLQRLGTEGWTLAEWLYQLFFLCWYLTIVNSFNFTDNMNGLMSGLSIIALFACVVYLGHLGSLRTVLVALLLVGALLGFMPFNFPRARVFLGDAGSLFVGYWMAWVQFGILKGFGGDPVKEGLGVHHLIPAVLIMGVPLFDAAFVVLMRFVEKRPVYLGDDRHLSHRLVRIGFTPTEAVVILWGVGIMMAALGILAVPAMPGYRYLLLAAGVILMVAGTRYIMAKERVIVFRQGQAS